MAPYWNPKQALRAADRLLKQLERHGPLELLAALVDEDDALTLRQVFLARDWCRWAMADAPPDVCRELADRHTRLLALLGSSGLVFEDGGAWASWRNGSRPADTVDAFIDEVLAGTP